MNEEERMHRALGLFALVMMLTGLMILVTKHF